MSSGSGMGRRSLGRQLRKLREKAGKRPEDVRSVGSRQKIWRMEAGKGPYKYADIRALCFMYGADEATTDRLTDLAGKADEENIWEDFNDVLIPGFGLYLDLEQSAAAIRTYDAELIHGLLQTPRYHEFLTIGEGMDEASRRRDAALRITRMETAFNSAEPPFIAAVIGESALHRIIGSADIMGEQVRYLRQLTEEKANIEVRILPWSAGAHPGLRSGAFTLLEFTEPDTDVVYLESQTDARYLEKESKLRAYRDVWATLMQKSVRLEEYTT
ncbi:helix-turn-helix domain-containing protein [Kineosporia sp. J2-2]|uniref:Helix-turn-helix domain-containing protein n=1 Tax=Kineosporia corallincola TaxID=2835133 RepID=A0ABS5T8C3_9ACTN|nr:helix-turn-helix transcriptional regulator [Kineosporia corallincola]MBT0767322.1 helix-turn-helix domain-containing protein [Kineosporia corallincola]